MTILSNSVLFLTFSYASSQPLTSQYIEKNVLIGAEISLDCPDSTSKIWEYSKTPEHDAKSWFSVVAVNGILDLQKGSINHLSDQVSENPVTSNSLSIKPTSIDAAGIYRCKEWGKSDSVAYKVSVFSKPGVLLESEETKMVAGKNHKFSCKAENAFPKPEITWYWNGQVYTSEDSENFEKFQTDAKTGLFNVESGINFQLEKSFKDEEFELECRVTSVGQWDDQTQAQILPVEFSPSKPVIDNIEFLGETDDQENQHIITCGDNVKAKPEPDFEWTFDPRLKNHTTVMHNKMTVFNVPLSYNGSMVTCKVKNVHGSEETTVKLVVLEFKVEDQANMSSNTILMIGVIVAAVLLAVLGGIVTYRRCSQQADYQTREDGKTAGPDGISYEQNPEVEALAPGEDKVQKELLM